MNLRQLEIFDAVMRAGSVTGAAKMLNLTQPAVSKILLHTEDQLKFALFKRIGGRLHPTPEAQALFPEVERVFGKIRMINQLTSDLKKSIWGRVTIATLVTLGASVIPAGIARFRSNHPNVNFTVHAIATRYVFEMVLDGEADIGIIFAPFNHALVAHSDIGTAEIVCVMPQDHILANRQTLTPKDLRGYPLICGHGNTNFGNALEEAYRSVNEELKVALQVTTSMVACGLVAQGAGIALTDPFAVPYSFPGLSKRRFVPRIEINPRVIHRADRPQSELVKSFVSALRLVMDETEISTTN